jgi:organic hydroperoxide reductase OsmC/OhrA
MTPSQRIIETAEAHVTGGRAEGHGSSADGALEVDLRTPAEMGGQGGGTNPEELFAVGYAAELGITLPAVNDPAVAEALVSEAHRTCTDSTAIRGNIGVARTVNGRGVETTFEAVAA